MDVREYFTRRNMIIFIICLLIVFIVYRLYKHIKENYVPMSSKLNRKALEDKQTKDRQILSNPTLTTVKELIADKNITTLDDAIKFAQEKKVLIEEIVKAKEEEKMVILEEEKINENAENEKIKSMILVS